MPELTYELVAPLIKQRDVSNSDVRVVFECPVSGEQIRASARINESEGKALGKEIKSSLWRNMRWGLSRMMYSVFGYGVGGVVGSTLVDAAGSAADGRHHQATEPEIKLALVDAFKSVGSRFAWDESNQRFVSTSVFKDLQTEFTVAVQGKQITQGWDRGILARMLAEIASADGKVAEGERDFFHTFLQGENLDNLLERAAVSKADLEETSADVRYVMWLLAAAMAVSDQDFDASEQAKLAFFGAGLGISAADQTRGLELAKEYMFDQALEAAYADGRLDKADRAHLAEVASALGIHEDRAARLDARCRKRKGIL